MTVKGRTLKPGGTIGVPAPASPYFNRSEILRGVEWWESKGYKVKLGAGIHERDGYVAGGAEARAADVMTMFTDDEVDVVQCFHGGYGSATDHPAPRLRRHRVRIPSRSSATRTSPRCTPRFVTTPTWSRSTDRGSPE